MDARSNSKDPTAPELQLGRRLCALRNAKGYTQDQLAAESGFTKGYLSKIENSKVIPPIGTLVKIARVLDTDLADLFGAEAVSDQDEAVCVVRSMGRQTVIHGGMSFGYDYIALAGERHRKHMEPFVMIFPPDVVKDVHFEHHGEEFMFVLSGKVELEAVINQRTRTWVLTPGDSAYFDSSIPHRGRSLQGESRALVVIYRSKRRRIDRAQSFSARKRNSFGAKKAQ
jgi:transcriptional regulator with XRE-family HTH domain/quercetin dioxygenase-like cupin family protein